MRWRGMAAALMLCACGAEPVSFDPITGETLPIYGGTEAPNEHAVVGLALSSAGYVCTGTLITPNVVLTAAHCIHNAEDAYQFKRAIIGATLGSSNTVLIDDMLAHPSYSASTSRNDIGLVRLQEDVTGVTPIPPLGAADGLSAADVGDPVRIVGYGRTATEPTGTKRAVSVSLGVVCGSGPCAFSGASVPTGSFAYEQESGGPCLGDSGGPALIERQGIEYVAGVTATGDNDCTDFGISTTVDKKATFIADFINAAGGSGGAGGSAAAGSGGSGGSAAGGSGGSAAAGSGGSGAQAGTGGGGGSAGTSGTGGSGSGGDPAASGCAQSQPSLTALLLVLLGLALRARRA